MVQDNQQPVLRPHVDERRPEQNVAAELEGTARELAEQPVCLPFTLGLRKRAQIRDREVERLGLEHLLHRDPVEEADLRA